MEKPDVIAEFAVNEILSLVKFRRNPKLQNSESIMLCGYKVRINTLKMQVFKKSRRCSQCGRIGHIFKLEKVSESAAILNLYHIDSAGNEILMTRDHIIPRAIGGPDTLVNSQTMCEPHNHLKDCKVVPRYLNSKLLEIAAIRNIDLGGAHANSL